MSISKYILHFSNNLFALTIEDNMKDLRKRSEKLRCICHCCQATSVLQTKVARCLCGNVSFISGHLYMIGLNFFDNVLNI